MHSEDEFSDKDNGNGATMHSEDDNGYSRTIENLRRASTWLMRVSEDDIALSANLLEEIGYPDVRKSKL